MHQPPGMVARIAWRVCFAIGKCDGFVLKRVRGIGVLGPQGVHLEQDVSAMSLQHQWYNSRWLWQAFNDDEIWKSPFFAARFPEDTLVVCSGFWAPQRIRCSLFFSRHRHFFSKCGVLVTFVTLNNLPTNSHNKTYEQKYRVCSEYLFFWKGRNKRHFLKSTGLCCISEGHEPW